MNVLNEKTMINMSWMDIEQSVIKNEIILFPLGVIEEHGPHLCLGTDIYTSVVYCQTIQDKFRKNGIGSVLAPPFYWGVCQSTGTFIGSFRIKRETATLLIIDILESLFSFGYKKIIGINAHGDIDHHIAIIDAFKKAKRPENALAAYAFTADRLHHYGLSGEEDFIVPIDPQEIQVNNSKIPDIHAGDIEMAMINQYFPEGANTKIAEQLAAVQISDDQIMKWLFGGYTKELSQNGYLGDPSNFRNVRILENVDDYCERIIKGIRKKMEVTA